MGECNVGPGPRGRIPLMTSAAFGSYVRRLIACAIDTAEPGRHLVFCGRRSLGVLVGRGDFVVFHAVECAGLSLEERRFDNREEAQAAIEAAVKQTVTLRALPAA